MNGLSNVNACPIFTLRAWMPTRNIVVQVSDTRDYDNSIEAC
ncbi:MAG TPA: hypothetical protein VFU29_04575 [Chitinophagaceae bacterium]|nr:hypothetical protein [Chitinophagaceae bacterium]